LLSFFTGAVVVGAVLGFTGDLTVVDFFSSSKKSSKGASAFVSFFGAGFVAGALSVADVVVFGAGTLSTPVVGGASFFGAGALFSSLLPGAGALVAGAVVGLTGALVSEVGAFGTVVTGLFGLFAAFGSSFIISLFCSSYDTID